MDVPGVLGSRSGSWTLLQKSEKPVRLPDAIGGYDLGHVIPTDDSEFGNPIFEKDGGSTKFPRLPGEILKPVPFSDWKGYQVNSNIYVSTKSNPVIWASITRLNENNADMSAVFSDDEIIRRMTSLFGVAQAIYRNKDNGIRLVYSNQSDGRDPYKLEKTMMCTVVQGCTRPWMPSCSDPEAVFTKRFTIVDVGSHGGVAFTADPSKLDGFPIRTPPIRKSCVIPTSSSPFSH